MAVRFIKCSYSQFTQKIALGFELHAALYRESAYTLNKRN